MINYKEIFEAWKIASNPTKEQEELALERLNICLGCDKRTEIIKGQKWSAFCSGCGCPINKKVFTKIFNACPLKKWKEVDSKYLTVLETKNKNTLI